jgi:hypothetical protein
MIYALYDTTPERGHWVILDAVIADFFPARSICGAFLRRYEGVTPCRSLPVNVPAPLPAWATPYRAMAGEDQLRWPTLDDVTHATKTFLDPVLDGALDGTWNPFEWTWSPV